MAGWTTGTCEANGIDVHYLRTGGDKPPVLLLHGLMTSEGGKNRPEMYTHFIGMFAPRGVVEIAFECGN